MNPVWYVYIVRCGDASLYTGVTTDPLRRLHEHNSPDKGARYTRGRQPLLLIYTERVASREAACRREARIKKMSRAAKLRMIAATGSAGASQPG